MPNIRELLVDEIEVVAGGAPTGRTVYVCYDAPPPDTKGGYDVPCGTPYDPVVRPPLPTDLPDRLPLIPWSRFPGSGGHIA